MSRLLLITVFFYSFSSACLPTTPYDVAVSPLNQEKKQFVSSSSFPANSGGSSTTSNESANRPNNEIGDITSGSSTSNINNGIDGKKSTKGNSSNNTSTLSTATTAATTTVKSQVVEIKEGTMGIEENNKPGITKKSACPPTWDSFSSIYGYKKCYKVITGEFDYLEARQKCTEYVSSIVVITTKEEYNFIKNLCYTGKTLYLENIPYIGLIRDDVVGQLRWEGGETEGYVKFYENNEPGPGDGDCFKFVTDQTIAEGNLLHDGQKGYYVAVDCLLPSTTVICEISL